MDHKIYREYDDGTREELTVKEGYRTPIRGYTGFYVRDVCGSDDPNKEWLVSLQDLATQLTGSQLRDFIVLTKYTDMFNILECKLRVCLEKEYRNIYPYDKASRLKSALLAAHAIMEYEGKIMLNPFVVLPKPNKAQPENRFMAQQIWRYLNFDKDAYFEGIDEAVKHIF